MVKKFFTSFSILILMSNSSFAHFVSPNPLGMLIESIPTFYRVLLILLFLIMTFFLYRKGVFDFLFIFKVLISKSSLKIIAILILIVFTSLYIWKRQKISSFDYGVKYKYGDFYDPDRVINYLETKLNGEKEFRKYKHNDFKSISSKQIEKRSLGRAKEWLERIYEGLAYLYAIRSREGKAYIRGEWWKKSTAIPNRRGARPRKINLNANQEDLDRSMMYVKKSLESYYRDGGTIKGAPERYLLSVWIKTQKGKFKEAKKNYKEIIKSRMKDDLKWAHGKAVCERYNFSSLTYQSIIYLLDILYLERGKVKVEGIWNSILFHFKLDDLGREISRYEDLKYDFEYEFHSIIEYSKKEIDPIFCEEKTGNIPDFSIWRAI